MTPPPRCWHAVDHHRPPSGPFQRRRRVVTTTVELAIRDVKDQALAHLPCGQFDANAAWTVIGCLAHNLLALAERLGAPGSTPRRAGTHRARWLMLPGRLTRHARTVTLHLPAGWRWQRDWEAALKRLRALPALA